MMPSFIQTEFNLSNLRTVCKWFRVKLHCFNVNKWQKALSD